MRRILFTGVALFLTFALGAESLAACQSKPAKKWTGHIVQYQRASTGLADLWFQRNDCSWADQEELNGFDSVVFNVGGYGGVPAKLSWKHTGAGLPPDGVSVTFRFASCQPITDPPIRSDDGRAVAFTIPAGAKWATARVGPGSPGGSGVDVTIQSAGISCAKKMSLNASPKKFSGKRTVKFVVKSGGRPVKSALVKVGGKKKKTSSAGVAKITLGPYSRTKRLKATAKKAGYKLASTIVTVRRR